MSSDRDVELSLSLSVPMLVPHTFLVDTTGRCGMRCLKVLGQSSTGRMEYNATYEDPHFIDALISKASSLHAACT
jgi:hypothetical protein